jgi:hypothetical protein
MSSVPFPTFTPNGFLAPSDEAVLSGVVEDWVGAFGLAGFNLNLSATNSESLTTPQGQLATSQAAVISQVNSEFITFTNLFDPAYTFGRYQDAIGRIYYMQRIPGAPTLLQVSCIGLAGTTIPGGPNGALVVDQSGNIYQCDTTGTIGGGGSVTLPFECINPGAGPIPVPDSVSVYQAIPGWDTATLISGVEGQNVESRSAFEARRFASVASNSMGQLASIHGAVLAVPGVLDAYVYENDNATPLTVQGFTLAPNSVYVAVVGGDSEAVGKAIWSKKAPGCAYNGNTTVQVQDTSASYQPPYPTYNVTFEIPLSLPFVIAVAMADNGQQPANATTLIQTAVVDSFEGEDNNVPPQPGAKIATKFFASRLYANIAALGSWAQIVSIELGTQNSTSAVFTASITGTSMVVTAVSSGTLAPGQTVKDTAGGVAPGTTIVSGPGGGGTGTYVVTGNQNVSSRVTMVSITPNLFDVLPNLNQDPTLDSRDVAVTFV